MTLLAAGHATGWPILRGGAQALPDALARYLEDLGGRIETAAARERLRDATEAFELTERQEREIEEEYEAWKLLLDQMKEADAAQASNLEQALAPAIARQFQELTQRGYQTVQLTAQLAIQGVIASGALRPAAQISVGQLLTNCCPVARAIACCVILSRQITFRNRIPTVGALRPPLRRFETFSSDFSEAKIRRLFDANIIGIFVWNLEGEIIEANEAFLHLVDYSREDLVAGRVNWKDLTPAEWRDRDERAVAEAKATGTVQPREKEYFRKDGSRVPVLVGAAIFEGSRQEGVAFVLDLSEQKRAENERKRAEEAVQKAQAELAHVTRVAALGELTASIAHEISQPLAAVVTNANASLRWLSRDSPNLAEACEAIRRVIRDGNRAGDVISRTRALFKKAGTTKERLDINEAIKEVLILAQSEVQRNRVSLETQLVDDLPPIMGDRTQVQQVMLNLLINAIEAMSGVGEGPRELWLSSEKFVEVAGESEGTGADRALADAEWTHVLITVRDSGPGVDPKSLDRLFDAFYTTKPQGMGMGLAISRSIIEAHGGRLWAMANASRGAVFRFTLPIHTAAIESEIGY